MSEKNWKTEELIRDRSENRLSLELIAGDLKRLSYSSNRVYHSLMSYKYELEDLERVVGSLSNQTDQLFRRVTEKMFEVDLVPKKESEGV